MHAVPTAALELLQRGAVAELVAWGIEETRDALTFVEATERGFALDELLLQTLGEVELASATILASASTLQRVAALRAVQLARRFYGAEPARSAVGSDGPRAGLVGLVGRAPAMQRLYQRIQLAARGRETTLVVGESGVGKELVTRAIHALSGDPPEKLCAVNCAALPRELLESELFGHRRGAFSGASGDHQGLVRAACCGTLYLDEVSELAPEAQAKLLRMIQERAVRPLGEVREAPVNVRVVASTNRPIREALDAGALRRDLYYRLQRLVIEVPPLREHLEDVPLLVEHFVGKWRAAYAESRAPRFTPAALERLAAHRWPGNIRELENVVFAACAASGSTISAAELPLDEHGAAAGDPDPWPPSTATPSLSLRSAEADAIQRALRETRGNKARASRLLGISRKQLYVKLKLYDLLALD